MTTKILTRLSATVADGAAPSAPDILRQINSGLEAGQFRTLNLSPAGLIFKRGANVTAFIPHDELWRLEQSADASEISPAS